MDTEAINEEIDEEQDVEEEREEIQSLTDAISLQGSDNAEPITHQMMNDVSNELEPINDVLNLHDGCNPHIEPIAEEVMTSFCSSCMNQGMSLHDESVCDNEEVSDGEYQEQDETPLLTSEEFAVHSSGNVKVEELISQEITCNPILADEVNQEENNPSESTSDNERECDEDGEAEEHDDETPLYPGATISIKVVLFLLLAFVL